MLRLFQRSGIQPLSQARIYFRWTHSASVHEYDKEHDPAREDQSFQLPDGRTMGFAEYGDQKGTPTFFLHGSPGSRYDGIGFVDVAKRLDVRIVCPDRPGFGVSSVDPSRKLSEYPKDISALAKHLKIPKYHVFGQSGGGPYTIACAYSSPKDELLNAAVVAGMGPPEIITVKDAGWYTVAALALIHWAPGFFRFLASTSTSDKSMERQMKFVIKFLPAEDREMLSGSKAQGLLMKCFKKRLRPRT